MDEQERGNPEISVVLSTYRRAETLRRTLQHLALQDLEPERLELIIVDDGSPDDTATVVAEFVPKAPFPVAYLRHENRGPGYTQNRGIEHARGRVVLLMADDIFLTPDAVRAHLEHHRAHPEDEAAVLGRVVQSGDLDQSVFLRIWDPFKFFELDDVTELPPYRFFAMNISAKRDFLVRHRMFLEHRGRGGPSAMEDLELGCRLHRHGLHLRYSKEALGTHYHVVTLDQAITRWYERGLNFGEFRRHTPMPELLPYFHVLTWRNAREYAQALRSSIWFRGAERSFVWHVVRHAIRATVLNRTTARWLWRPLFDAAETHPRIAALMKPQMYRAFLYYHFLRGVSDGRRLYGD
jgi:glycosyltransferase involved in cell wall biosynthesis